MLSQIVERWGGLSYELKRAVLAVVGSGCFRHLFSGYNLYHKHIKQYIRISYVLFEAVIFQVAVDTRIFFFLICRDGPKA
jgi:hypothetical protein